MNWAQIKRILSLRSLFSKWVVFFAIGAALIVFSVFLFVEAVVQSTVKSSGRWMPFLVNSAIQQLGDPPQFNNALAVKANSGMTIRYEGPVVNWTTSEELPRFNSLKYKPIKKKFGVRVVNHHSKKYFLVKKQADLFLVKINRGFGDSSDHTDDLMVLALRILLVFFLSLLFFRWQIKPLRQLSKGLTLVSSGQIGHQLPDKRTDELGDISRQFNQMSRQIEQMMQSRKQLLQDVSHELRSPLTRMRLSLAVMSDSQEKNELEVDIAEMNAMLSRLLESSRLDRTDMDLKLEPTDILGLLRTVASQMKRREPGVVVVSSLTKLVVSIDPGEIRIVVNNLVDNALKYSAHQSQPVSLVAEKTNSKMQICIRDYGTGIPAGDIPFLFEPFYRVDKSRSSKIDGHGLGLSICRKIVTAHQGTIQISNTGNEGTEVVIELPL
jgi:signal transduction histidine kinase